MHPLKYGCNPNQSKAYYACEAGAPFQVLNGKVGYINLLDALNAWQLVKELRQCLHLPAAASFKHVSPAGAAVGVELGPELAECYGFEEKDLTLLACAYLRARGADPSSSFGDFIALSDKVDLETAQIISKVVSDGVIAPAYDPEALALLKEKKKGGFIILQADWEYTPPEMEDRLVYGIRLSQSRNDATVHEGLLSQVVTDRKDLPEEAKRDLLLGLITLKYTQSNSTGFAFGGQMIGIGAGQQSRVDCTKLAGRKADNWYLRQHPKVLGLNFKDGVKRQERINWRLRYVEGDMTDCEQAQFSEVLSQSADVFKEQEKREWLAQLKGVSFVSDAFIPFRDNLDHAVRHGVKYVAQTGGSVMDEGVTEAANEYGMVMVHCGIRLFHH